MLNHTLSQPSSTSGFSSILNPNHLHTKLSSHLHYSFSLNPKKSKTPFPNKLSVNRSPHFEHFHHQNNNFTATKSSLSPPATGSASPRFFVGHSIYKGKAALTVEPRAPEFAPLDSGSYKLSREGCVLLQFAPAASVRQYDWSRKQVFLLSITEIGTLMSLGAKDSCEFFHDPFKGKRLCLLPPELNFYSSQNLNQPNAGVQNKLANMDESIYIPVTRAELTVLVSAFNFLVPYLLGWHAYADSIKPDDLTRGNNANPRAGADFEWSR
uniref:Uncharacterized protein n=1 Tax=Daucus carota subsp. sativus TaxID=79200 RepID=A0A166EAC2_DAUCS